ncbi:MAG: hypothetical protein LLG01_19515 [Planctomycetaceae bacterium]|nr:hypothetical protein [Planctomycetaceae bacterium]
MTPRRYLLQLAALAAAASLALGQSEPAAPAASQPSATSASGSAPASRTKIEALTECVSRIAAAPDVGALSEYLSQARAIDRDNPAIYQACMKRALQLGRPSVAMAPALELTRLRDDWAGAWSVICYCHARRGKILWALTSVYKAMDLLSDDQAVLNNAAICLAWYEDQQPRPRVSAMLKTSLEKNKPAWMQKPVFAEAYAAAAGALASRRTRMTDLDHDADNAHDAYYQAKNAIAGVVEAHNRTVREISDQRTALEQIVKAAAAASRPAKPDAPAATRQAPSTPQPGQANRDRIAELEKLNQQRVKQVADLTAEARAQRQKAAQLRDTLYKVEHALPDLAWMPPTVEGKPAIDREKAAPARRTQDDGTEKTRPADIEPTSPDVKVKMAEMLLQNGLRKKAAEALGEIIAEHPGTPAAAKAQQLLTQHKLQ